MKYMDVKKIFEKNALYMPERPDYFPYEAGSESDDLGELINKITNQEDSDKIRHNFEVEKELINKNTREELDKLSTGENVTQIFNYFSGSRIEKSEILKNINLGSFKSVLNNPNTDINNIHEEFKNLVLEIDGNFTPFNISRIKELMSKNGYTPDGFFGGIEAASLYAMINDIKETQDRFNSISFDNKLQLLLDFNIDGELDNLSNFNSKEIEALKAISNEKNFSNVLSNLGIDKGSFDLSLQKNYFSAREELKTAIARFSEIDGTSLRQLLLTQDNFRKTMDYLVVEGINESSGLKTQISEKLDNVIKSSGLQVSDEVRDQAITAIFGSINGAGYTTNTAGEKISNLTKGVLDNISIGYSDGKIGLILSGTHKISDNLKVSAGLTNFIPFISATGALIKPTQDSVNKLFSLAMSDSMKLDGNLTVGTEKVFGAGLKLSRVNEQTSEGIRLMVNNMSKTLDSILSGFPEDNFDSFIEKNPQMEDNLENREVYNKLLDYYKSIVRTNKDLLPRFKRGLLRAYQNELYKNAQGFNLNGISIGMLGPILIGGFSGEYLNIDYKQEDTSSMDSYINHLYEESYKDTVTVKEFNRQIDSFDKNSLDSIKSLSGKISNLIEIKDIRRLGNLENKISNFLNGKIDLASAWQSFINSMNRLRKDISFIGNRTDNEKILILQSVAINLMKKEGLNIDNNSVSISKNQTIESYDKSKRRGQYFDKIFGRELSSMMGPISQAREKYYNIYGSKNGYEISQIPLSSGVGFTGVELNSGKNRTNALNPYVGANVATFNGEIGKVELTNVSTQSMKQIIDKLPGHILSPIISQLESVGYVFKSNDKFQELRDILLSGVAGEIKIDKNLYFAKAAECLNDMILMDFKLNYKGEEIIPGEKISKPSEWGKLRGTPGRVGVDILASYDTDKPRESEKPNEPEKPNDSGDVGTRPGVIQNDQITTNVGGATSTGGKNAISSSGETNFL